MAQTTGEQLKQARTKRGLTIEQASQATHIRPHYLEALENDQREALPSPVQGRGFLRIYADLLNLPVEPLLAAWDGKVLPVNPTPSGTVSGPPEGADQAPAGSETTESQEAAAVPEVEAPPVREIAEELPPIQVLSGNRTIPGGESQAIFTEIGETLHKQREALGLSIAEVERYTRLRQHYIQAMEEGRIDHLPSPVQGRGMLSNYASFLNLDEEKMMLRFAEGLMARRVENMPAPDTQPPFTSRRRPARQAPVWRRFLTPDLLFGVIVAAIILIFSLWTAARINTLRGTTQQPTPPGVSEVLLTPLANTAITQTPSGATPGAQTAVSGETTTGASAQTPQASGQPVIGETSPVLPGTPQPGISSSTDGTPQPPGVTATIPPINKDPLQIYIVAKQRAWLRIIADDKIKFLGRTVPGNAYAFSATKRLELLTGDASAIQVFYNQKDLGTLGSEAQVVGLVFVPQGILTPTAAFTPTSLPTKPATPTALPTQTPLASPTITPYIPTK